MNTNQSISTRLTALRAELDAKSLDGYIVPSSDPHGSEYVAAHYRCRAWISGFSGSAGTAVVTRAGAGVWTDSRYYLEAEQALADTEFELFRAEEEGVPDYAEHLCSVLPSGAKVGICSSTVSCREFDRIAAAMKAKDRELVATEDLIGRIWSDRPALPSAPVVELDTQFAGETRAAKLGRVRAHIEKRDASAVLLGSLDDIAWLCNLRGADISYNPVFLAYMLIERTQAILYLDTSRIDDATVEALRSDEVGVRDYDAVHRDVAEQGGRRRLIFSPDRINVALRSRLNSSVVVLHEQDITTWFKARKNCTEISGIRQAMVRDGVAMVRFLRWLEEQVPSGTVGELDAVHRLRAFRAEGERFVGESFPTISGYAGHGAIVHYSVTEQSNETIGDGMYLVDSGAQYLDGTTDITRTVWFGRPDADACRDFTVVLQAHIALATIAFPVGTTGAQLDAIARSVLWRHRKNYGHGTGHGVGCYLGVHEGPQRIAPRGTSVALEAGMVCSNEPGLYRTGKWGIRIENLVHVAPAQDGEFGPFHEFETLSLCPIETRLIDVALLTDTERVWVDEYHSRVYRLLSPKLDRDDSAWLAERTAPIDPASSGGSTPPGGSPPGGSPPGGSTPPGGRE